jgi:Phosphotransferase enzyme family
VSDADHASEHVWPEALVGAAEVRRWIAAVLPGQPEIVGSIQVMQAKEWGVTASFAAVETVGPGRAAHGREVIFKAGALPLFAGAPRIAEMLSRCCPGLVPHVIAWEEHGRQTWTLFAPFEGSPVAALHALEPLLAMGRTLARIQTAVAALPSGELDGLPRSPVEAIPGWLDELIEDVRERQLGYWQGEGREMAEQLALPGDVLERLAAVRPRVAVWSEELLAGGWPESIDHVDLHWENAVVKPDGSILIFDWEEAALSFPFFSLDRLLNDARELDLGAAAAWGGHAGGPLYTDSERALRETYLDALPWGTRAGRKRAFELAMRLAPIKTAHEGLVFAKALGWREGTPFVTAWALTRALPRWETQI